MADIWDKDKRSYVMSKIRSKNTKPEILLRSLLLKEGFRFRIHDKKLPGKPDVVLKKYNTVISFMAVFGIITKIVMKGVFQIQILNFGKKSFPKFRTGQTIQKKFGRSRLECDCRLGM